MAAPQGNTDAQRSSIRPSETIFPASSLFCILLIVLQVGYTCVVVGGGAGRGGGDVVFNTCHIFQASKWQQCCGSGSNKSDSWFHTCSSRETQGQGQGQRHQVGNQVGGSSERDGVTDTCQGRFGPPAGSKVVDVQRGALSLLVSMADWNISEKLLAAATSSPPRGQTLPVLPCETMGGSAFTQTNGSRASLSTGASGKLNSCSSKLLFCWRVSL